MNDIYACNLLSVYVPGKGKWQIIHLTPSFCGNKKNKTWLGKNDSTMHV